MKNLPQLKVVVCCAAHDEIAEPENFAFPHCATNAICSHRSRIIDIAISRGVTAGLMNPEKAAALRQLVEETRIELIRWTDRMASLKRLLRLKKLGPSDLSEVEADLVRVLGPQRESWRKRHGERQLEIAKPILEIVQYLQDLGLLECDNELVQIDVESLVAKSDCAEAEVA